MPELDTPETTANVVLYMPNSTPRDRHGWSVDDWGAGWWYVYQSDV